MKKSKELEPLGNLTDKLEEIHYKMIYDHKMQIHEILGQFIFWAKMHAPDAFEKFNDGTDPVTYHGHKDGLK